MQITATALRPRTSGRFASLMELYERNYMLVRLLAPGLRTMTDGEHVSCTPGAMPLVLDRVEHGRYTTTFNLTYRFSSRHRHAREPDLSIRLYHDARTCEVMSGLLPGERRAPRRTRDLDEGWRLNRFLHRWLGYCLRQGHGFGPVAVGAVDTAGGSGAVAAGASGGGEADALAPDGASESRAAHRCREGIGTVEPGGIVRRDGTAAEDDVGVPSEDASAQRQ